MYQEMTPREHKSTDALVHSVLEHMSEYSSFMYTLARAEVNDLSQRDGAPPLPQRLDRRDFPSPFRFFPSCLFLRFREQTNAYE